MHGSQPTKDERCEEHRGLRDGYVDREALTLTYEGVPLQSAHGQGAPRVRGVQKLLGL